MAQRSEGISQLFGELDGPYRHRQPISLSAGSARMTIDSDVREDAGLDLDMDAPMVDSYWFSDRQKLVIDFEGVGDD